MTKSDLIAQVCKDAGINRQQAQEAVESVFNSIKKGMKRGAILQVRGFGTFKMRHYAEKKARNIQTGATVIVAEHNRPVFTPSKNFDDVI